MSCKFRPIAPLKRDAALGQFGVSDAERYWMEMKEEAVFEEQSAVTSCDFSPVAPIQLASTSGTRLSVLDASSCDPVAIYSRFKERTYSAKFRPDGALLGVSTHSGELQFFDVHTEAHKKHGPRNAIRTFRAHQCKVNAFDYDLNGLRVFSMADDGVVKLFDLSADNSAPLWTCAAHRDTIRSGAPSPISEYLLATGSYDHCVKLWDIRQNDSPPAKQFDHGAPVERLLFFPGGGTLASAGGALVKLWDLNSGAVLATLKGHNKTITSMCLARGGRCLLTGGIDCRLNFVQLDTKNFHKFPVLRSLRLEAPVLSLAMGPGDRFMAMGMGNKLALYRRRKGEEEEEEREGEGKKRMKMGKMVKRGKSEREEKGQPMEEVVVQRSREGQMERSERQPIEGQREKVNLGAYDRLLRAAAFRSLVGKVISSRDSSDLIVAIFHQILIRQGLRQALSDQTPIIQFRLSRFLISHLLDPAYFDTLLAVTTEFLDIYMGKAVAQNVRRNIQMLEARVGDELRIQQELSGSIGILNMVMHWGQQRREADCEDENDEMSGKNNSEF